MAKNPPKLPPTINVAKFVDMAVNYAMSRAALLRGGGTGMDDARRDLDGECGYPVNPTLETYKKYYQRELGRRVVNVYPEECWAVDPDVYQTEKRNVMPFEKAYADLKVMDGDEILSPVQYLAQLDEASGIGQCGAMLIGVDKGGLDLERPLDGVDNWGRATGPPLDRELLFLRVFDQSLFTIDEWESDTGSPRFMRPKTYNFKLTQSSQSLSFGGSGAVESNLQDQKVHWSRVIHFADNTSSNPSLGSPRQEAVLNRLWDCRKILGGSAEMFWKGGYPGMQFYTHPTVEDPEINRDEVARELYDYLHGLQRALTGEGGKWETLSPNISDPTPHLIIQLQIICTVLGVPMRIFMGSEAAHLASTQDGKTWNRRLAKRQMTTLTPRLVRPFVNRMMAVGVLPRLAKTQKYIVEWKDLNALTEQEMADVATKKSQALFQYTTGGVENVINPFHFLTLVMGFSAAEAGAVIAAATTSKTKDVWKKPAKPLPGQAGGPGQRPAPGTRPPRGPSGAPKR